MKTPTIVILCTGDSGRSHIAEGVLSNAADGLFEIHSAGTNPIGYVHPLAIEILAQAGIDISQNRSKHLSDLRDVSPDVVITVCDEAKKTTDLLFENAEHFHWGFGNPAKDVRGAETMLDAFRRVLREMTPAFEAFAAGYKLAHLRQQTESQESTHRKEFKPEIVQRSSMALY